MVEILFDDIFRVEKLNPDDKKLFEKGIIIIICHAYFSILSVCWLSLTGSALLFLNDERRFLFSCLYIVVIVMIKSGRLKL